MENSNIAWTDDTFNIAWGCQKVSPGCSNCYAETLAGRYRANEKLWGPPATATRSPMSAAYWKHPVRWNKLREPGVRGPGENRLVFCSSMADVFEDHPVINAEREKLWSLIRRTRNLTWQLLTKRPENIARMLPDDWELWYYPNVWLGVSIESDEYVHRARYLTHATFDTVVKFVSYEPALGPLPSLDTNGIDWLIYGGESGAARRPDEDGWVRSIAARCKQSDTAFFYKQSSGLYPGLLRPEFERMRAFPYERTHRDIEEKTAR